jgi:hypothetical protein
MDGEYLWSVARYIYTRDSSSIERKPCSSDVSHDTYSTRTSVSSFRCLCHDMASTADDCVYYQLAVSRVQVLGEYMKRSTRELCRLRLVPRSILGCIRILRPRKHTHFLQISPPTRAMRYGDTIAALQGPSSRPHHDQRS